MSKTYQFEARVRTALGTGASRRLRNTGWIPAIIYGGNEPPMAVSLPHDIVNRAADDEGFYSHVIELDIDSVGTIQAIVKDVHRHAFKPKLLHVDLQRVDKDQPLQTHVPLHFVNEDVIEKSGGLINHLMNEVEIKCKPQDLPEFIEVDVQSLQPGHAIHLSDIQLPNGVSLVELGKGTDHDHAVVTVQAKRVADDEADADAPEAKSSSDKPTDE